MSSVLPERRLAPRLSSPTHVALGLAVACLAGSGLAWATLPTSAATVLAACAIGAVAGFSTSGSV